MSLCSSYLWSHWWPPQGKHLPSNASLKGGGVAQLFHQKEMLGREGRAVIILSAFRLGLPLLTLESPLGAELLSQATSYGT